MAGDTSKDIKISVSLTDNTEAGARAAKARLRELGKEDRAVQEEIRSIKTRGETESLRLRAGGEDSLADQVAIHTRAEVDKKLADMDRRRLEREAITQADREAAAVKHAKRIAEIEDRAGAEMAATQAKYAKQAAEAKAKALEKETKKPGGPNVVTDLAKAMGVPEGLMGAGLTVAAFDAIGHKLEEATRKAAEFSTKLREGQLDASGIAIEIGKAIPLIGSFVSSGQNIREIFTGERTELERQNQYIEAQNKLYDIQLKMHRERITLQRENREAIRAQAAETANIPLRGEERTRKDLEAKGQAERNQIELERNKRYEDLQHSPDVKEARKALQDFDFKNSQRMSDLQKEQDTVRKMSPGYVDPELANLEGQRAALQRTLKGVTTEQQKLLKENQEHAEARTTESQKRENATRLETDKLFAEKRVEVEAVSQNEVARMAEERAAVESRTAAKIAEAREWEIKATRDAAIAATNVQAEREKNAETDPQRKAEAEARRVRKVQALEKKADADMAQARKEASERAKAETYAAGRAEGDAKAATDAETLRQSQKGYEAEESLAKRAYERKLADIDRAAEAEIAANSDNAQEIRQRAAAEKKQAEAEYAQTQRQQKETRIAGQFGTAKELVGGRIESLQQEAKLGNIAAASEAKRLQIASEFADKRAKLNAMIRDPKTGEAEKKLAEEQLKGLDAQEKRAQQLATFTGGAGMAEGTIMRRGGGAAARAREEQSPFVMMTKMQEKSNNLLGNVADNTKKIAAALSGNPDIKQLFAGM